MIVVEIKFSGADDISRVVKLVKANAEQGEDILISHEPVSTHTFVPKNALRAWMTVHRWMLV